MPSYTSLARESLYRYMEVYYMLIAFFSGVVCTVLSLFYSTWLPWAPLAVLVLVTYTVYSAMHQPIAYYESLKADYNPTTGITTLWVPNNTRYDTLYYAEHDHNGGVFNITTCDPLDD